jgi:hypothetical protein
MNLLDDDQEYQNVNQHLMLNYPEDFDILPI